MSSVKVTMRLAEANRLIREHIAELLNTAASSAASVAQQLAPVDTGYMKANIKQTELATPHKHRAVMSSEAPYSAFVNFGTSQQAPQPFFTMGAMSGAQAFTDARVSMRGGTLNRSRKIQ